MVGLKELVIGLIILQRSGNHIDVLKFTNNPLTFCIAEIFATSRLTSINRTKINWKSAKYKKSICIYKRSYDKAVVRGKPLSSFFGNAFGEGVLAELSQHVGKEYAQRIQKSLDFFKKKIKGNNLLRPIHHDDVQFILNRCSQLVRKQLFEKLQVCKLYAS